MKKKFKIIILLLLIIILTYGTAWGQMYRDSKKYYRDAMESYNRKNYAVAIKGQKVEDENSDGYVYKGGFQQAADIWSSAYAIPKPKVYFDSKEKINEIINNHIDIKTGTDMFNKYFKIDKGYLNQVMLRVVDLYIKDDDKDGAKETLELIKEAFPNDAETQKIVKDKLDKIK